MKTSQTSRRRGRFVPLVATGKGQAAIMQLKPGETSDEQLGNEHPASEQWLFVVAGSGTATVVSRSGRRRHIPLRPGALVVIEEGELHQIRSTGRRQLDTINFYVPPAYRSDGALRPRAKRKRPAAATRRRR